MLKKRYSHYLQTKEMAELDEMKCKVMLTNSNTPIVRELYAPFATHKTVLEEYYTYFY
jgi:hypothetical protein